ncbi:MAG: protein-disulfide reductase DsbD domain-containing protein [Planctomycetota bacterium]|nr:protein-disulfide reductase DsbD domain-containing protein [Planctomycetota bacterium]
MTRFNSTLIGGVIAVIATASLSLAQFTKGPSSPPKAEDLVTPRLITETKALAPGARGHIAITFEIAPEWHMYWKNPGDTGMAPIIDLELPEGVAAGEPIWPTPRRYRHAGTILDYIFEERLTIIIPVAVESSVSPGEKPIAADLEWLVCKEVCLAGLGRVEGRLVISDDPSLTTARTADAAHFAETRRRAPQGPGMEMEVRVMAEWRGGDLALKSPGAELMIFYPLSPEEPPNNILEGGETRGSELILRSDDSAFAEERRVVGVVETRRGGESEFHRIEIAAPQSRGG